MLGLRRAQPQVWKGGGAGLGLGVLLLYALFGVIAAPALVSAANVQNVLYAATIVLPTALGMQALLILGRFDLSAGAIASLVGMIVGISYEIHSNALLSFLTGALVVIIVGVGNGLLVGPGRINPLIATLATMGIIRSAGLASNNSQIVTHFPSADRLIRGELGPLNLITVLFVFVVALVALAFRSSSHCRRFYALGEDETAAVRCGIRAKRLIVIGYLIAALGAGTTGILQGMRQGSASPLAFPTLSLESIAACMIGGSALSGGRGTMLGAAIGTVVIAATQNLVVLFELQPEWTDLAIGVLLLLAMALQRTSWNWLSAGRSSDLH